jgi:hypothetical protein
MDEDITPAAWVVLQATHDLQGGDAEASIDTSAVRAAALALIAGTDAAAEFQEPGGTYAGIEAQVWALKDAGYVLVDVGMAPATAPSHAAHVVVDDDYGIRLTEDGRAALTARSSN